MADNKEYRRSQVIAPKTTTQFNQFLPSRDKQSGYVPAPLRKKRAERNEDSRRSWASPMFTEDDGTFTRLFQKNSDSEGSKSVSDITESEMSNSTMELRLEELQKMRNRLKESEDKWQDDLSRWKSKRRSVNSDIVKKKEEREQIEQITSVGTRKSKTFKEMQDERESRGQSNLRDSFNSIVDDVFEDPVPRSRTLPPRSYTIDTPYTATDKPFVPSIPSLREKEPVAGTLASDQTDLSTKPARASPDIPDKINNSNQMSQTTTQSLLDDPVPAFSNSSTSLIKPASATKPTSSTKPNISEFISNTKPAESSSDAISSLYKPNSMDTKPSGLDQVSASLPKIYQRSDSARLTSVVMPRPFGTQSNRIASLPRAFTMDDSVKRTNGESNSLKKTAVQNRYAQYMTDEDKSQQTPDHSSEEEEVERTQSPVPPVNRVSPLPKSTSPLNPPNEVGYNEMRISLNQKPNSSRDFGFQHDWDSTGVRVKSVAPGSPAEFGQVQAGDEILTVNGHRVADMSYSEWKNSMEEALQQGSLLMDIRRQGKNSPSEPYHTTSLDFTSQQSKDAVVKSVNVSSQPAYNHGSNGINGAFREDSESVNNKESISLKNLKRRSEFFEQGGSETPILNVPVPSITASTTRWSWDPEEERKRQEKWQKEQDRLLKEKYKKDQEKLDEEWKKAQQELNKENFKNDEELNRHSLSTIRQPTVSWEEQNASKLAQIEEDKKKRQEEMQRLEEERRKREEEMLRLQEERRKQEEQQRLEEEKRKKEEEERKKQIEEKQRLEEERRRREEQQRLEELRRKREEEQRLLQEKERNRREEEKKRFQEQESISKSTPELDEVAKTDIKASGGLSEVNRDYQKEPLTQSELERQQILQEMRKKTSLNTDNSWIRQSTSSVPAKEPIDLPIRRGESLDNLDEPRSSWRSSWSTSNSTSSIPDYSRPHSALSGSTLQPAGRPGSATMQASQSMSSLRQSTSTPANPPEPRAPQRNRSVSGRKICSFCDTPLGKGAAMIIESLGLCYHLTCFKCSDCRSDLGGSQAGAEVRIRNQQLYCNVCYMRLKTGQPTAM
ncbi:LIM domain only protein 7 isoform X49 [Danio rerio]